MLKIQTVVLFFMFLTANAVVLFEIEDESGNPIFIVDTEGVTFLSYDGEKALGDTLMTISSRSIRAHIGDNGKGLSRSFSVASSTGEKGLTDVLNVSTDNTRWKTYNGNDLITFSNENIYMGENAGTLAGNSQHNIFIGNETGNSLVSAVTNVMIGMQAGMNSQNGIGNVFLGGATGIDTNGDYNVIIGHNSGRTSGAMEIGNTFLGSSSGMYCDGSYNLCLGYEAGRGDLSYPITGHDNIFIGKGVQSDQPSDSYRLAIGSTYGNLLYGNFSDSTLVVNGNLSDNTNNRTFFVNGSAGGTTAWNNDSDKRLKKEIKTIDSALEKVMKLRGVTYEWKDPNKHEPGRRMGFIAQESVDIIPEAVDYNKNSDHYTMQYASITAVLVEAIKELKNDISSKFTSITENNNMINEQNKKIDILIKENKKKDDELESLRTEIDLIKSRLTDYASK